MFKLFYFYIWKILHFHSLYWYKITRHGRLFYELLKKSEFCQIILYQSITLDIIHKNLIDIVHHLSNNENKRKRITSPKYPLPTLLFFSGYYSCPLVIDSQEEITFLLLLYIYIYISINLLEYYWSINTENLCFNERRVQVIIVWFWFLFNWCN